MTRTLSFLAMMIIFSCGYVTSENLKDADFFVTVNHYEEEEFKAEFGETILGRAIWWDDGRCRVDYAHDEEYHRVLGHELRHCIEGKFHP
jgi:hypothetical protein